MKLTLFILFFTSIFLSASSQNFIDKRDSSIYNYVKIETLYWMTSNLNYMTKESQTIIDSSQAYQCGQFYLVNESSEVCPTNWRLPTESEVKRVLSLNRKKTIHLNDTLQIGLCGRSENHIHAKHGEQSTFWMDAVLNKGSINHWHVFNTNHDIHFHNVVNAERRFPVRCVREVR